MKRVVSLVWFWSVIAIVHAGVSFGAEAPGFSGAKEVIARAERLVSERKYESAFKLLAEFDKDSNIPEVALRRSEIALKYHVQSVEHYAFGFVDLKEGETLDQYRATAGPYRIYPFEVDHVLEGLAGKYPKNGKLFRALGEYYYEVAVRFGDNWMKPQGELLKLAEKNLASARDLGESDYYSLFVMGTVRLAERDYERAAGLLKESIRLKEDYPPGQFNMAYVHFARKNYEEGLPFARKAYDLYGDRDLKSEAARMVGVFYRSMKDNARSIEFYEKSNELVPKNFYTLTGLVGLYLETKDAGRAGSTAEGLFSIQPKNPRVSEELLNIYYRQGYKDDLQRFFSRMEDKYAGDPHVVGNLRFYRAKFFALENDREKSRRSLELSRESYGKVFPKEHKVFRMIDKALEALK